jgi:hypothetical protein
MSSKNPGIITEQTGIDTFKPSGNPYLISNVGAPVQ